MNQKMTEVANDKWCHYCRKDENRKHWAYMIVPRQRKLAIKYFCSFKCMKQFYIECNKGGWLNGIQNRKQ